MTPKIPAQNPHITEYRLVRRSRITPAAARKLVLTLAMFGNNSPNGRYRSHEQVEAEARSNGLSLEQLVQDAREYSKVVPVFENFIGSSWRTTGAKVSLVDAETDREYAGIEAPGVIAVSAYWQDAELTWAALERAVKDTAFGEVLTALTHGVAAVENYVNYRSQRWNFTHADNLLIDDKTNRVTFDRKIDEWIPVMSGKRLDKSGREWQDFIALRRIRDTLVIHVHRGARAMSYEEMADAINRTRTGIGGLLVQLHQLFEEEIPARIIRMKFAPDVRVAEV